ncbi:MAG: hypothetical protein QM820_21930 [Minicystis sp.]
MSRIEDVLLADLKSLIAELGTKEGVNSAAVYDTAQVLRLCPPDEGVSDGLDWLLSRQQADGGWGAPSRPMYRDIPTLAAVLVLDVHEEHVGASAAVRAGMAFLARQAGQWAEPLPDDLPGAAELLLPRLVEQARAQGLEVARERYAALFAMRERRLARIARIPVLAGTTAAHGWEGWGTEPDPRVFDGSGGVGNSPAATAAWAHAAAGRPELSGAVLHAKSFLSRAWRATGLNIPGVVPESWPLDRFEQAFGLYPLFLAGLLGHPALRGAIEPQIQALAGAMRPDGIASTDYTLPDGDDTAAALALLHTAGRRVDGSAMLHFEDGDHFCTWRGELQPSISVTARAVHALALLGVETGRAEAYLLERQRDDGRWTGDKWNGSWLYTTSQVMLALAHRGHERAVRAALAVLLRHQSRAGGWGADGPTLEETAYVLLALRGLPLDTKAREAARRAERWMLDEYRPFTPEGAYCWLAKEPYRPHRISRLFELAAMAGAVLGGE